jgi:electron transport complex protein RnfB
MSAHDIASLDECLPQTQCTRCGYPRCRAYAEAIARGEAAPNRCPPGGEITLRALARELGSAPLALDPAVGTHEPRTRAIIDEAVCIGCRKCLDACPVDAIIGARKFMHTVIQDICNGCGLCLPPCPVDCIRLDPVTVAGERWPEYRDDEVRNWRERTERHFHRLARRHAARRRTERPALDAPPTEELRAGIAAALARVRARRGTESR